MTDNPCEWCQNTSEKIDSLEHENSELRQKIDQLKESNAQDREVLVNAMIKHATGWGE